MRQFFNKVILSLTIFVGGYQVWASNPIVTYTADELMVYFQTQEATDDTPKPFYDSLSQVSTVRVTGKHPLKRTVLRADFTPKAEGLNIMQQLWLQANPGQEISECRYKTSSKIIMERGRMFSGGWCVELVCDSGSTIAASDSAPDEPTTDQGSDDGAESAGADDAQGGGTALEGAVSSESEGSYHTVASSEGGTDATADPSDLAAEDGATE